MHQCFFAGSKKTEGGKGTWSKIRNGEEDDSHFVLQALYWRMGCSVRGKNWTKVFPRLFFAPHILFVPSLMHLILMPKKQEASFFSNRGFGRLGYYILPWGEKGQVLRMARNRSLNSPRTRKQGKRKQFQSGLDEMDLEEPQMDFFFIFSTTTPFCSHFLRALTVKNFFFFFCCIRIFLDIVIGSDVP